MLFCAVPRSSHKKSSYTQTYVVLVDASNLQKHVFDLNLARIFRTGLLAEFCSQAHCARMEKFRKILAYLRSKTCFQQVGQVSARKLKNLKAFCFCVNSTFVISRTEITPVSLFLEVLWDSDAHFSSY